MTGAGYLRYVADLLGAPRQRVLTYLDLVGLSAASNLPIAGYSLGMRQRLGLASALIGEARTLVLDEPVTVSYTHLDVYKRQGHPCIFGCISGGCMMARFKILLQFGLC